MLSANGIKAIFFDLDGTLRHNLPSGGEVFADCALKLGLHIGEEDRLRAFRWEHYYWANSLELKSDKRAYPEENADFWHRYARRQLVALGASNVQADELAPQVTQYMQESYQPQSVVPDEVVSLLPVLKETGYNMAVISNRVKPYQQEIESLGLAPFFDFSLAGGEINAWKPEPDIFLHACQLANVTPEQAIYVGDNYFADVVGARRAGLQPILYDPRGIFPEAGCPVLISFGELPSVLRKL